MTLKKLLYAVISVIGILIVFISLNLGLNLLERTFRDVDFINLKEYCRQKNLSENYGIVVDYSIPSGKHRFFVCDLKKEKIIASSLCAHGAGKGSTIFSPVFSNEVGSN